MTRKFGMRTRVLAHSRRAWQRAVCVAGVFALGLLACVTSASALQDNKGTEFVLSFIPNYSSPDVELHLTADEATDVTVEYPVNSPTFTTTVPVVPGTITTVALPVDAAQGWTGDTVSNNSVRLSAAKEFVTYMINRVQYTSDAALGLPVDVLNTEYIVMTYNESFLHAQFAVTGVYDNTSVTVTPSNDLVGGHAAGAPYNFVLNRGEGILLQQLNSGANGGLAGTIVSTDKPVSVTNGNQCTQVPSGTSYCDVLMEVAQPVQSWGREVLVTNVPNRPSGAVYRVLASQDATEVLQNGASVGTINRGQYLEVGPVPGDHVFSSTNPIFVDQFITGSTSPGATSGDPAMSNFGPTEQYLNAYTFATVGAGQFAFHWVMLIAATADVGTLTLDGVAVPSGDFTPIAGTAFSSSLQVLTEGTHQTSSTNPHGIWVVGYNQDDSYSYPGGARFQAINNEGDPWAPVCTFDLLAGPPVSFNLRATELHPAESGEGFVNEETGVFFVELAPGANNLTLNVPAFVPGVTTLDFSAGLVDPNLPGSGTVKVTDGAGNFCEIALDSVAAQNDCTEQDISALLQKMRSRALAQYKYNLELISRLSRDSAKSTAMRRRSRQLLKSLNAQLAQIPALALQCTETQFCVRVTDNQRRLKTIKRLSKEIASLTKSLMPKVPCTRTLEQCRQTRKLEGVDNQSRRLLTNTLNSALKVPGVTSVCN